MVVLTFLRVEDLIKIPGAVPIIQVSHHAIGSPVAAVILGTGLLCSVAVILGQ